MDTLTYYEVLEEFAALEHETRSRPLTAREQEVLETLARAIPIAIETKARE